MEEEFQKGFDQNNESQSLQYDENVNAANENTEDAHTQHMGNGYGSTENTWKEYTDSTYEKKQQGERDAYTGYSSSGYQNSGYQNSEYQNSGYRNNGYQNQENTGYPPQQNQGFGLASMIMGIVSLVMFCSCINIPLAITAMVFGVIQLSRTGNQKKGMAIAGIVTSILSIVMFVFIIGISIFGYRSEVRHGVHSDIYEEFFDDLYEDEETF